jgi:AcrR family transcriptional regulator
MDIDPDKRVTTEDAKRIFLAMLGSSKGNVSKSCIAAGIARATYYRWLKKDELFASLCAEVDEALLDNAEDRLQANIDDGQNQAIIFYLKTKGKARGYIERQEISGPDGQPLELINNVTVNLAVLSTKELEQLQKIANKIREAGDDGWLEKDDRVAPLRLISIDSAKSAVRSG